MSRHVSKKREQQPLLNSFEMLDFVKLPPTIMRGKLFVNCVDDKETRWSACICVLSESSLSIFYEGGRWIVEPLLYVVVKLIGGSSSDTFEFSTAQKTYNFKAQNSKIAKQWVDQFDVANMNSTDNDFLDKADQMEADFMKMQAFIPLTELVNEMTKAHPEQEIPRIAYYNEPSLKETLLPSPEELLYSYFDLEEGSCDPRVDDYEGYLINDASCSVESEDILSYYLPPELDNLLLQRTVLSNIIRPSLNDFDMKESVKRSRILPRKLYSLMTLRTGRSPFSIPNPGVSIEENVISSRNTKSLLLFEAAVLSRASIPYISRALLMNFPVTATLTRNIRRVEEAALSADHGSQSRIITVRDDTNEVIIGDEVFEYGGESGRSTVDSERSESRIVESTPTSTGSSSKSALLPSSGSEHSSVVRSVGFVVPPTLPSKPSSDNLTSSITPNVERTISSGASKRRGWM